MKIIKTDISEILIILPDVYKDSRGYFFESFNFNRFLINDIETSFVQDNISKSSKGTIRGLHYQTGDKAQGKLCQVIKGKALDIALDIRFGSPTFGKYVSFELSEDNHAQLWIPPGFAHGFSVLSDEAIFLYKCTEFYSKEHERTILYNDPQLNINWGVDNPVISEKDLNGKTLDEIEQDFTYSEMKK
ncbi:MAG TPA: dTDP-4-dehydrorhamnose 3,5-epimerase [Ignavibacteriaceae bacterium]|nr:dTDP-4-dehydrorhamnose 3,5-epimerase [Ignavibacteriaceae bacterium]